MLTKVQAIVALVLLVTLSGCGGGGSSSSESSAPPSNSTPSDITLSGSTIPENEPGSAVGRLSTTDSDSNDSHTYSLSGGDSSSFAIEGDTLSLDADTAANFEVKPRYALSIATRDSAGASFTKDFVIDVLDRNDPPILELISQLEVLENVAAPIVTFRATDEDDPDDLSTVYSLSGDDGALFGLSPLPL